MNPARLSIVTVALTAAAVRKIPVRPVHFPFSCENLTG